MILEAGIKGTGTCIVTEELTARAMGSGELEVYATPAMIALMEETAYQSVSAALDEGAGSVGTLMNVKHVAASPVGMKIICQTELVEVDGRRLTFHVEASDEKGLIGEGTHERFIVKNAAFQEKADSKRNG